MLVSSPSHIIGVDVADIRRPNSQSVDEFFRLMKRQFTPAEWVSIKQPANELDRLHMFYRHWSLKEVIRPGPEPPRHLHAWLPHKHTHTRTHSTSERANEIPPPPHTSCHPTPPRRIRATHG
jgi:hypothetical protein